MIGSYKVFCNVLLLLFTKVQSQINHLQKDSLGKSNERIMVLKIAIFAQKLSKIKREEQS